MITVGKSTCFYRLSQVDPEVAYLAKSRYKSTRLTRPSEGSASRREGKCSLGVLEAYLYLIYKILMFLRLASLSIGHVGVINYEYIPINLQ